MPNLHPQFDERIRPLTERDHRLLKTFSLRYEKPFLRTHTAISTCGITMIAAAFEIIPPWILFWSGLVLTIWAQPIVQALSRRSIRQ